VVTARHVSRGFEAQAARRPSHLNHRWPGLPNHPRRAGYSGVEGIGFEGAQYRTDIAISGG
jgi:hypothetical protein